MSRHPAGKHAGTDANGEPRHPDAASRIAEADHVQETRESMPPPADIADLADVFSLLGEPGRVRILTALLNGRMAVRDLAAVVELSESAVSHALRLLRAHRVVEVRRHGRLAYYALADAHVRALLELALEHVGHTVLLHPAGEPHGDEPPAEQPGCIGQP